MKVPRWLPFTVLTLALLLSLGCGKARFSLATDVVSETRIEQEVSLIAEGFFAELFSQDLGEENEALAAEGWTVTSQSTADDFGDETYVLTMRKRLDAPGQVLPEQVGGGESSFDLQVADTPDGKEYRVRVQLAPSEEAGLSGTMGDGDIPPELQPLLEQFTGSLLKLKWTITLPGQVVDTNADRRTERSGTWVLDLQQLQQGSELWIVSREARGAARPAIK